MSEVLDPDNKNLVLFLIITFLFSWILWLPSLLTSIISSKSIILFEGLKFIGSFGPFVAAFSLTYFNEGLDGIIYLWKRGWHYNNRIYLLISIFLIPLLSGISFLFLVIFKWHRPSQLITWDTIRYAIMEFIVIFFLAGPFQEEFGWRGYMLDRLQIQFDAVSSSLILGFFWSGWHLPLFFMIGTPQYNQAFLSFFFQVIIISVLFTWLHNNTKRSIFIAMIFHTTTNMVNSIFPVNNTVLGSTLFTTLLNTVMVIVIIIYGPEKLKRNLKKERKR
ncbi:MAG: lysostaphin resistance A-like protein [Candidatus Hodarchaeota archaeon]